MADSDIEFGVTLWNVGDGEYVNVDAFEQIADATEEAGFDFLWTGEHPVLPTEIPDTYPFTPDGSAPLDSSMRTYDVFEVLSYLAGRTDDLRLGTNVCVVPYRHPVITAKSVLTLNELLDGAFDFGVAVGWLRTEFEVLDVPFEKRGARLDEFFRMFERICAEGEFAFDGEFHSFQKTGFYPVPDDGKAPPIYVGGKSGASVRRIAEFGDGWTSFWERPDDVREMRERLNRAWDDFDRDGDPAIAVSRPVYVGTDTDRNTDRPLLGRADKVIADVEAYADAGTTKLHITTYDTSLDAQLEQIRRFGDEIIPSF
ncbi:TIGR03619 family F420-dependent LLM class oxidoreductase [Haladaptatus halobius]|uniref:TIGR03619 family F420-dependent LLM class oxidoreductase n=1 Tax=Haladaptatus halobius TaxID=2884875 RepID=UPI001D0AD415|nr:TIGR03619 family F420-dependent LLM class oxidoreductase [Haladaptatus halobius]